MVLDEGRIAELARWRRRRCRQFGINPLRQQWLSLAENPVETGHANSVRAFRPPSSQPVAQRKGQREFAAAAALTRASREVGHHGARHRGVAGYPPSAM